MSIGITPLGERFRSSVDRVVEITNFSCDVEDGKTIIRGDVESRDEATLCNTIARLVPGSANLIVELRVPKSQPARVGES